MVEPAGLPASVTVLFGTATPLAFFSVTVIVDVVTPSPMTEPGLAETVERPASGTFAASVRDALAELPVLALVEVTVPVLFENVPAVDPFTETLTVQLPPAEIVPP